MSNSKKRQGKHLDIEDRLEIQACIHKGMDLGQIASVIGVSKSTVCRELKRNAVKKEGKALPCKHRRLGLCNKCCHTFGCPRERFYYDFREADEKASLLLRSSRAHVRISDGDLAAVDEIVKEGVAKGQSLHHIYASDPELRAICCERTVRRLCYKGLLSTKAHQLRRYVRYSHSYSKKPAEVRLKNIEALPGRMYRDYLEKVEKHPRMNVVQYDSVIGKQEDKRALLTITFPKYGFQFGYVIRKGFAGDVAGKLNALFARLGNDRVREIFPINLSDNGSEFSSFHEIEADENGEKRCSCYFTTPYRATDKAACERLHELVRYFLPKGHSLNGLTQEQVDDMYSHINSYVRKSQGDRTPYDIVRRKFGQDFLDIIGIRRIPNKKVRLLPIA